jgi:hypothetical protein
VAIALATSSLVKLFAAFSSEKQEIFLYLLLSLLAASEQHFSLNCAYPENYCNISVLVKQQRLKAQIFIEYLSQYL